MDMMDMMYKIDEIENYLGKKIRCKKTIHDLFKTNNYYKLINLYVKDSQTLNHYVTIETDTIIEYPIYIDLLLKHFELKTLSEVRNNKIKLLLNSYE